ncbi:MAG: DUF6512 family protein [Caldisericia bacterium]|nr:DUF6512 family protein [Caldisericia bacterium]
MSDKKFIFKWQLFAFLFTVFLGSFLHFLFELSGNSIIVAYFAAVNESTWEHLKLAFFPALIFSIIEYPFVKKHVKNYFFGKVIGFYIMPITIIVLFYGYKILFKSNSLIWDIFIFVLSVFLGEYVAYKFLIKKENLGKNYIIISIILFIIIFSLFSIFTYFPLKNFLFKDPVTGGYGIIEH